MTRVLALSLAALLSTTSAFAIEPIISLEGHHRTIERDGGTDILLATREETDGRMWVIILPNVVGNGPGPAIVQSRGAESWYVLDGSFEFHVGDKTFDGGPGWGRAGPGTFLSVDAGQPHGYIAKSDGHILVIYTLGGYEHFFEDWGRLGLKPGPDLGKLENSYGVTRP